MLKLTRPLPGLLVLTLAFAAAAQSRGPVVPNFQQPEAQQKRVQAARAQAAADARAQAQADAVEKARVRALAQARRNDEARCAQKRSKKLQGDCRATVAARYDPAPMALPALALAPLVAPPPDSHPAATAAPERRPPGEGERRVVAPAVARGGLASAGAVPAVTHEERGQGARLASAGPVSPLSGSLAPIPRNEAGDGRERRVEVHNDLQVGPQSLLLDHLSARAEVSPDSLQAGFTYRFALDDAGAAHHLFGASLESARCADDAGCGLRWFGFAGLSPSAAQTFAVQRTVSGKTSSHTDQLGWSAGLGALGVSYSGRLLSFGADGQLEALSVDSTRNTDSAPARTSGTLDQLRLRATAGIAEGAWSGSLRIAGYVYAGTAPESFQLVPLRGALVDDDSPGLSGAPQSFQARVEGRYDSPAGLSLAASYGYLSYVGPYWTSANLIAASVSQRFGRFRLGIGLVYEGETDRTGAGYPTLFGTGTAGASF